MRPYAPLATLLAASVVRRSGREVALFDAMLSSGEAEFEEILRRRAPRVVAILEDNFNFLTKMCTQRNREACVRLIRSAKSAGARVVVNGSDASDDPAFYLDVGADAVILGETERTVLDLLDAWDRAPDADLHSVGEESFRWIVTEMAETLVERALHPVPWEPTGSWPKALGLLPR